MLSLETFSVGAAPAENIQMASCPDGSGQCQVATAVTQGMIFNKLAGMTVTKAPASPGPNILVFNVIPKTTPGQLDALSIIKSGLASAPGSRVAVDVANALGPSSFAYMMFMAPPGGQAPPLAPHVGPGSNFALINADAAATFQPTEEAAPEKKEKTIPIAVGAAVGAGGGGAFFGLPGAIGGAVAGGLVANWLVG